MGRAPRRRVRRGPRTPGSPGWDGAVMCPRSTLRREGVSASRSTVRLDRVRRPRDQIDLSHVDPGIPRSSSGTTTSTCWRSSAPRSLSMSAGPGFGRSAATRTSRPQPRPRSLLLGTGCVGQRSPAGEQRHRCRPVRSCTWTLPSMRPSEGWSTDGSPRGLCRAWPSRSAKRRRRCSTPSTPVTRSTSSPRWRRRSP